MHTGEFLIIYNPNPPITLSTTRSWWIIDPPCPKVSYDVMTKGYKAGVDSIYARLTGKIKPLYGNKREHTSEDIARYKEIHDYEKSILDFLLSLKR